MKHFLLYCFFILTSLSLAAQARKTYTVKPGEKVSKVLPKEAVYLYPGFKDGTVNFKNNNLGSGKLNYNQLIDEMEFINEKGDTLALNNGETIASIYIDRDTFYFYEGFIKNLVSLKEVKFASRKKLVISNRQKIGGMGELSSASIETYTKVDSDQGVKELIPKEVLTFSEYTNYFIGDNYNNFKPLNKKNLLNAYSKQQKTVESYLKENSTNFLKEDDLYKLIQFLQGLTGY